MKLHLSYICLVLIIIFPSCKSSKKVTSIDFSDGSYVGEVDGKGLKHGKGSYKWLDGSFYEGDFEKDLRHGIGHFRWANGESYKGDYLQDQYHVSNPSRNPLHRMIRLAICKSLCRV